MRIRRQDSAGDMMFGAGQVSFYQNTPQGVAQLVATRLNMWLGEWFADTSDGMDWYGKVLGRSTTTTYDTAIRQRILDTPGVTAISSYSSTRSGRRKLSVSATIETSYGTATVTTST